MDLAIAYCFHLTHPVALVFLAQGLANEAYTTCSSILAQLGEAVPDIVTEEMVGDIIPETLSMYSEICGDDWLGTKMETQFLIVWCLLKLNGMLMKMILIMELPKSLSENWNTTYKTLKNEKDNYKLTIGIGH